MKSSKIRLLLGSIYIGLIWTAAAVHAQLSAPPVTTGLQLWLKADTGAVVNGSGQVTTWTDQSGLGNNATQPTGSSAPTVQANALNGHSVLRFNGSQFMSVPDGNGINSLTNATILIVAEHDNYSGYHMLMDKCLSNGNPAPFDWWNNSGVNNAMTSLFISDALSTDHAGGAGVGYDRFNVASFSVPAGGYNVWGFSWTNGAVEQFVNGNNVYTSATTPPADVTNAAVPLRIGLRADGVTKLVGGIAEILVFSPPLADADLYNTITNYLTPKYGITAPDVSITSPINGSDTLAQSAIPVSISVTDTNYPITSLKVFGNGTLLGTATPIATNNGSGVYQLSVAGSYAGQLTLTATAADQYGRTATSLPIVVTVTNNTVVSVPVTNGLSVWLSADVGVTTDGSGNVISWTDQTTNGNSAIQATDGTPPPVLVNNVLNGKPVLRFNGTPECLEISDAASQFQFLTNGFTTFAIVDFTNLNAGTYKAIWTKAAPGIGAPLDMWYGANGVGEIYYGDGNTEAGPLFSGAIPTQQFIAVGAGSSQGTNFTHYLFEAPNGAGVLAPANVADNTAYNLRIGRRQDNGPVQMQGDMAEILIYNRTLSDAERTNVMAYLCGKYGLVRPKNVSPPPVVALAPTNGSSLVAPISPVVVNAAVSSSLANSFTVKLLANGTQYGGSLTAPPYQIPLAFLTPGTVTLIATATDNWGLSTSVTNVVTVTGSGSAPLPTTGLQLQLAADLGIATNSDGTVASWADQSGNGNNAGPTGNAPSWVPNVLNGKPVVHFDGTLRALSVPDTSLGFTAGDLSVFSISRFTDFGAYRAICTKTSGDIADPFDWYFASGSGKPSVLRGNGSTYGGPVNGSSAPPTGAFAGVGFSAAGQTISEYMGYGISGSGNIAYTPLDNGDPLSIGGRSNGDTLMKGDIAEILIYNHAVTSVERKSIMDYLYYKWGICDVEPAANYPSIALTTPANGTSVTAPGILSIVASVAQGTYPVAQVNFIVNGLVVGTRAAPPYQIPLQLLAPGTLQIQAQATDIIGDVTNTPLVTVTVNGSAPALPPTVANLVLWLKADAGVTTNVDGSIANWQDQSGNGNSAGPDVIFGGATPLLSTNVNGTPTVSFDGFSMHLMVTNSPGLDLVGDMSLFYSAGFNNFSQPQPLCCKSSQSGDSVDPGPHPFDYYVRTSGQADLVRGNERGQSDVASSGALPSATNVVAGVTVQGSDVSHYLNLQPNGTGSLQYNTIDDGTSLLIGLSEDQTGMFGGNLNEILIYNTALSASDVQQVHAYLAGRNGLPMASLYTGSPSLNAAGAAGRSIQLSWPPGFAGFVLQGTTNLSHGAWMPIVTNPPNNRVTLSTTNAAYFFRLMSQ